MQNTTVLPTFNHLPEGTYYTTGRGYSGLSRTEKDHAIVHPNTGGRISLVAVQENCIVKLFNKTKRLELKGIRTIAHSLLRH